jgi:molybdopterin synthase sulfur carrier subunit
MSMVTVRYWAAAKQAAGVAEEKVSADTLAEALAAAVIARGRQPATSAFATVLARSSFLVDGTPVGSRALECIPLADAAVIEVLPPFAGG